MYHFCHAKNLNNIPWRALGQHSRFHGKCYSTQICNENTTQIQPDKKLNSHKYAVALWGSNIFGDKCLMFHEMSGWNGKRVSEWIAKVSVELNQVLGLCGLLTKIWGKSYKLMANGEYYLEFETIFPKNTQPKCWIKISHLIFIMKIIQRPCKAPEFTLIEAKKLPNQIHHLHSHLARCWPRNAKVYLILSVAFPLLFIFI